MFIRAKAPAARAEPANVDMRVAPVAELPVEDACQLSVLGHVIAGTEVAVTQDWRVAFGCVSFQPAQDVLKRGARL